jgi:glycosyltransferase involved in cell wall biosynthesis
MKVFLISNMYPSTKNPAHGIFVKNFVENMIAQDVEIVHKSIIASHSFNVFIQALNYLKLYIDILYFGIVKKYNLIYIHFISHSTIAIFILSIIRKNKLIFNVHGTDLLSNNIINKLSRYLIKLLIKRKRVVAFVVPSDYFKSRLKEKFTIEDNQIIVSPSGGIDRNVFNSTKVNSIKQQDNITLGFVSRIERNKGWRLFVDLLVELKYRDIKWHAKIVGTGNETDEMRKYISELKFNEEIEIIGVVNQVRLSEIYNSLDVFIFPTMLYESLGLVGLEAMACGTIVIGSRIGGILTYIEEGKNGFLFDPGNLNELVSKTIKYISLNESEKLSMRNSAIEKSSFYDKKKISRDLYENVKSKIK